MENVHRKLLAVLAILIVVTFGVFFDMVGLKALSVIAVVATLVAILYVPTEVSLYFIITFIWFQGFFKIVSNYNPIVHVGADLVVITLVFKTLFIKSSKYKSPPPFVKLFALHFCWVAVTFFNPHSLSLVSNIAGSKIYVSMFLLYFFGYYLTNNLKQVKTLFSLFIFLALVQTVFTIYQGLIGPSSVVSIHPGYQAQLNKFIGYSFRPFGLTNLPGGPSVYIFMVLPFIAYFIFGTRKKLVQLLNAALLPLMGLALFMCQVRSAIAKAVLTLVFFIGSLSTSKISISLTKKISYIAGAATLAIFTGVAMVYLMDYSVSSYEDNEMSMDRSFSTFDVQAMTVARRGAWDRFVTYVQVVPFGAGFSRVGASAGAFQDVNRSDTTFSKDYFFSDNLFILLLIELGLPGVVILTILIGRILYAGIVMWRKETRPLLIGPQLAILSALLAIAAGSYGAEGIVYNPESCFFWLFAGVLMSMRAPNFEA